MTGVVHLYLYSMRFRRALWVMFVACSDALPTVVVKEWEEKEVECLNWGKEEGYTTSWRKKDRIDGGDVSLSHE